MASDPRAGGGDEPREMSFLGAAGWTIALSLLVQSVFAVTAAVRPGAESDLVNYTLCEVLALSVVLFLMLRVYARSIPVRDAMGLRPVAPLHVLLAAAAGAAMYPLFSTIDAAIERRFPRSADEVQAMASLLATPTTRARLVLVIGLCVVMPIARELFFRGMLAGRLLRGHASSPVVLATAVYFAANALDLRGFATGLALGLALGWLRAQSGSVVPAIAAHVGFYAVAAVPILGGRDPSDDVVYPARWVAAASAIAVAAMVAAAAVAARDARAKAARALDEE